MTEPDLETDLFDFDRYLERVGLSRDELGQFAPQSHALLHLLMWAQATRIPWENLSNVDPVRRRVLHPSSEAGVHEAEHDVPAKLRTSIAPNDVYHKLVVRRRGGYCYEHNLLLARALRDVGFAVALVAARGVNRGVISDAELGFPLNASTHLVLVATTADGARFLVDDGFVWAGAPRTPLRLAHAEEINDPDTHEVFRLVRAPARPAAQPGFELWGHYARTSDAAGRVEKRGNGAGTGWFLQYKPSPDASEFWDMFHFDETDETTITDCLTGAWYASSSPYHKQPHMRLAAIMTAKGRTALVNDLLTVREGGRVVSERTLTTEHEVETVLREVFGIA